MIDLHNHLLPGVDDGAATVEEALEAATSMADAGIRTAITTPHLRGSLTENPDALAQALEKLDAAAVALRGAISDRAVDLKIELGSEVMIDTPRLDLSNPRVRLAGTSFVLVEFPGMIIPHHSVQALYQLKMDGWQPIIAHPERYQNYEGQEIAEEWRNIGCYLQVNHGSALGRYGKKAQNYAWSLLKEGFVDFLSSDYHARGRPLVAESREALLGEEGKEQFHLLTEVNPSRLLQGEEPVPVPPLQGRRALWKRVLGR